MTFTRTRRAAAVLTLAALGVLAGSGLRADDPGVSTIDVKTLSVDASRVTGGDVLVQVAVPIGTPLASVNITVAGRDMTSAFRSTAPNTLVGLVTGLVVGRNTLTVNAANRTTSTATLEITNYPITGPVTSGPWQQPFICQTEAFVLPDGSKLGAPLDANCSARTVVQHVYRTTGTPAAFKPLPSSASAGTLPADLAKTTTTSGATVNFIVRVETGTMNRGIYQNAILHDPTSDPSPTPFSPPSGWNRRLLALHGSGCPSGWYIQGGAMGAGGVLEAARLAEGYAIYINTLNHPSNSCNAVVAGETAVMGKERFIETFGVPFYTITTGGSGGAYTSLQIADAFPGLYDGVDIRATFPDALSIALSGLDAHLLTHYFASTNLAGFTDAQKVAVSGYEGMTAFIDAANQAQRTDPVPNRADLEGYQSARWNDAVPASLRYDPVKNPTGARPTVFDAARNVYGRHPSTGAALRPFDNVGVQYGLSALNSGAITTKQFLDLNEKVGGYDQDANYVPARAIGDAGAIKRTYQSGLTLGANGGLTSIPIFDNATSNEAARYHYGWFHFAVRERLRRANGGNSANMIMWRSVDQQAAKKVFDDWMVAYKSDVSSDPVRVKVVRTRPKAGGDGCYDRSTPPVFIAEDLVFASKPVSKCSALYPVYSNPRREAGGPLAADILKCQLKPTDARDYAVTFNDAERARLGAIFPGGVCDWSKPGVNQTPVVGWASFGPSPKNLVFDVTK
ncbi:MAG: hypothetical protein A3H97_15800 [Acidobacteria bacterium RIFCSPLOWO2_02_FULL_65_29]|nr:MAG: hypothetical protein A3H97_15800 [Acidobacteria bacterium RIFCSPLOWO2_02_FULL_65_29]